MYCVATAFGVIHRLVLVARKLSIGPSPVYTPSWLIYTVIGGFSSGFLGGATERHNLVTVFYSTWSIIPNWQPREFSTQETTLYSRNVKCWIFVYIYVRMCVCKYMATSVSVLRNVHCSLRNNFCNFWCLPVFKVSIFFKLHTYLVSSLHCHGYYEYLWRLYILWYHLCVIYWMQKAMGSLVAWIKSIN
jgi:hypothetical protein